MKMIEIRFEDNEIWQISLEFIANHRADYYQEKDEDDFNRIDEVNYVMEDDYEGIDWFSNNMYYEDFSSQLIKIYGKPKDKDWSNADKRIIEVHK